MRRHHIAPAIVTCGALACGAPAAGYGQETDLVLVDIKAVAYDLAENIGVPPGSIPLTVKAPASVAADVCGVALIELRRAGEGTGTAGCVAVTSTRALEELVRDKTGR